MDPALYAEIKGLLDMPYSYGGRIWAYCPMHNDGKKGRGPGRGSDLKGRSLSLHPTYGLNCHAGCLPKNDTEAFKRMLELLRGGRPSSSRPPRQAAKAAAPRAVDKWTDPDTGEVLIGIPSNARRVAIYEYRNAAGEMVAHKGRWEWMTPEGERKKSFKWRLPNQPWKGLTDQRCTRDQDGEILHVKGHKCIAMDRTPLWGAELVSQAPIERPVWFCEGEKATMAVRGRNELAVCHGGGASTKEFGDAFEVLRGRQVRLWPDNDEPGAAYMQAVRKALHGIAKSVVIVQPPVPPKGDAFDYFAGGGKLEDVMDGVIVPGQVAVEVVSDDHFRVRIPHDAGLGFITFEFEQIMQMRNQLEAELTVSLVGPTLAEEPYSLRINLLSSSAREGLARALNSQFGKSDQNWTKAISTAYAKVREAFMEVERGMAVEDLPDPGAEMFLVDDVLPVGVSTVLFGDGSAGKSYTVLGLISAIAVGADSFAGHRVRQQTNVLYVDWENGGDMGRAFKRRCRRIWRGMGFDPEIWASIPIRYWSAIGGPLTSQLEPLRRYIEKHHIGLVVIDSAMPACGGSAEDSDIAMTFFNSLARLRVTSLVISHVSKDSIRDNRIPDRAYGNVAWHNMPRRTWYQRRSTPEGSNSIELALFCRKVNDGPMPAPIGLRLNFEAGGPDTAAWFETWDISESPELEAIGIPAWKRAETIIKRSHMAIATLEEVAEGLGVDIGEAYAVLNERRAKAANGNRGAFRVMGGTERSKDQRWGLNAFREGELAAVTGEAS